VKAICTVLAVPFIKVRNKMEQLDSSSMTYLPSNVRALSRLRHQIKETQDSIIDAQSLWPTADELLNDLQHELRTPIGNILACVQLLEIEKEMTPAQEELVGIIQQAAETIVGKLDELLVHHYREAARKAAA
jgi:signal transduction histidine kinase